MKFRMFRSGVMLLLLIAPFILGNRTMQEDEGRPIDGAFRPPFVGSESQWVDSVFNSLSKDERIAQLFMIAAYSNKTPEHKAEIAELIEKYKVGGLIFFQGGPVRQANLTNYYQSISKVPLLISIDGEWGLSMRLDSTPIFPRQMVLGAIQNDSLIYEMGREIARECKRMGIHVNLAPVADVNNNANNPVIGTRSFGEDKYNVARKAAMYMKGMQDEGILANAKHFPGHGDTDSDSHKTLPIINHSVDRLDSLELYPFKELINKGLGSMMVAHLYIPAYDTTANTASTLSKNVVTDLLKVQLGFEGLIFTDALNMKGVSKYFAPGEVDVKALLAGNDVLLFSGDVPVAIEAIKKAVANGEITQEEIDKRCRKILMAKQWCGLDERKNIETKGLIKDLNNPTAELVNTKLAAHSITTLINKNDLLPLKRLDTLSIASVAIGREKDNDEFQNMLSQYANVSHFNIHKDARKSEYDELLGKLDEYNMVIVSMSHTTNSRHSNYGTTPQEEYLLKLLRKKTKVVLNIYGNPYLLEKFPEASKMDALLLSYHYNEYSQRASAQVIFGGLPSTGKLPVTANSRFAVNTGIDLPKTRIAFAPPVFPKIDVSKLKPIDSIVKVGLKDKVYPGCQVFVLKDGNVVFNKSYGYHTYENKNKVKESDLYDIASVTKIVASTSSLMKMVDDGYISLDDSLGQHLSYTKGTNKEDLRLREILSHQAGLHSWIPFWTATVDKKSWNFLPGIYSTSKSDSFPTRVAEGVYINNTYHDTIYKRLLDSQVSDRHRYKYSDLGYYFVKDIVESKYNTTLDRFVDSVFYSPLGLKTMTYLPREKYSLDRIPPTENDTKFRKQVVHGDVHDQGAAMLGGVGGHAGIFSNAQDVAIMMQMFMNGGTYGGERYIDSNTLKAFTKCQYCKNENRRGAGFDKPEPDPKKINPVCDCVSYLSFGHSGFTGTIAWADPEYDLVYVFLSNRVHPNADINLLAKSGIRSSIQKVIYNAIKY